MTMPPTIKELYALLAGRGMLPLLVALICCPAHADETNVMVTRWAATVSPANVHAEYPRPQFVRQQWQNLNGLWEYAITTDNQRPPQIFTGHILVPFPIESHLSGVGKRLAEPNTLWYRRKFAVPTTWNGQRIQLHFGAVDWAATIWLNGRMIGSHRGGYDSFSFDLTANLNWKSDNELLVAVMDPTEGDQPRGKQSRKPEGIFYTPSSGIWQTVWLEPVPQSYLTSVRLVPDFAAGSVRVTPLANTMATDATVEVIVNFEDREVGRASCAIGAEATNRLTEIRPWSPSSPQLYDVTLKLLRGSTILDEVQTYFGLRKIHVSSDEKGMRRLFLNGQQLFQIGVLDQGFWPDGLYTAPSDEALRYDLEMAKKLGFNLVRKHVKVEPERWYYWADKLGLLVWQDMPSGNNATESGRRDFRMELEQMMDQKMNHPSIVMWILFNEGWGQFDTERMVRWMKAVDPTRLVDNASGWTDAKVGDVIDMHSYPEPSVPVPEGARAGVISEFGGLGLGVEGHQWSQQTWAYQVLTNAETLVGRYGALMEKVWELQKVNGLGAAVYTQLTDVESECNGFLTYDRQVLKTDAEKVFQANTHQPGSFTGEMLLPNALQGEYRWQYTTNQPPDDWFAANFDSSTWKRSFGGFGTSNTPGAVVRTEWSTADIWLRRQFVLPESLPNSWSLAIHHDEDVEVYLNGVLAATLEGHTVGYMIVPISAEAQGVLTGGTNSIAVHCHQTSGGQYIDVGLIGESIAQ